MPRYHFKCTACQKETIILEHDDHEIDTNLVGCGYCGGEVTMSGYFQIDDGRLVELQEKLDTLKERMQAFEDYEGIEILSNPHRILN